MMTPSEARDSDRKATAIGIGAHERVARMGEHFAEPSVPAKFERAFGRLPTPTEQHRWAQLRKILGEDPSPEQYLAYRQALREEYDARG